MNLVSKGEKYSSLEHLARSIWLNHDPARCWMAMYASYYDASSTEELTEKALVVVGMVSSVEKWLKFEREWNAVLSRYGVRYLHMKEFAHSVEEFEGWKEDKERRAEFLAELIRVMKRRVHKAFQYRLVPAEYHALDAEFVLSEQWGGAYAFTTGVTIAATQKWFEKKNPGHRLKHVVEHGDHGQGDLLKMAADDLNPPVTQRKIDPETKEWFAPFQATDLLAYESRLNIQRHLDGVEHKLRESLRVLLRMIPHQAHYFDRKTLRDEFAKRPDAFPRRPIA